MYVWRRKPSPEDATTQEAAKHTQELDKKKLERENLKLKQLLSIAEAKFRETQKGGKSYASLTNDVDKASADVLKMFDSSMQKLVPKPTSTSTSADVVSEETIFSSGMSSRRFLGGEDSKCTLFFCTKTVPEHKQRDIDDTDDFRGGADNFDTDNDEDAYVCCLDVNADDFWVIVDAEEEDLNPIEPDAEFDSDESYVFVDEDDLVSAISNFVALAVRQYPEAKKLEPAHLKRMLDGTFFELEEKGTLAQGYQYGCMAYTTYAYGQYAFSLYKDPAMVKLVCSGIVTASKWALMLFL